VGIETYAKLGKITVKNFDSDFLQPALRLKATQCIAFLLNWKNDHICAADEEKQLLRELNKDMFSLTEMRKLWKFSAVQNGFMITGYGGTEARIRIPSRVDTVPVIGIAPLALSPRNPMLRKAKKEVLEKLVEVHLPDSLLTIGNNAFAGCPELQRIKLSKWVMQLEEDALRCDEPVTVNVCAGSSAERLVRQLMTPLVSVEVTNE
jgi:hypothetical protein